MATLASARYILTMDTPVPPTVPDSAAENRRRLAREAALIAEADAEIAAGLFVDSADVDAWIDSIGAEHELPLPLPRR